MVGFNGQFVMPRITWAEILNEGPSRLEGPWECLWKIVLLTDGMIQPTMGDTISEAWVGS